MDQAHSAPDQNLGEILGLAIEDIGEKTFAKYFADLRPSISQGVWLQEISPVAIVWAQSKRSSEIMADRAKSSPLKCLKMAKSA